MTVGNVWAQAAAGDHQAALEEFVQNLHFSKRKLKDSDPAALIKAYEDTSIPYVYGHDTSRSGNFVSFGLREAKMSSDLIQRLVLSAGEPIKIIPWNCNPKFQGAVRELKFINKPSVLKELENRRNFFKKLQGYVELPEWTEDLREAIGWASNGIVYGWKKERVAMFENILEFATSDFWTKHKPHKKEYVIHLVRDKLIGVQEIVPRETNDEGEKVDPADLDFRLRTKANGFYKKTVASCPEVCVDEAKKAIKRLGLDFCAIKVMYRQSVGKAVVLSVDTTPIIPDKSMGYAYAAAIKNLTA